MTVVFFRLRQEIDQSNEIITEQTIRISELESTLDQIDRNSKSDKLAKSILEAEHEATTGNSVVIIAELRKRIESLTVSH